MPYHRCTPTHTAGAANRASDRCSWQGQTSSITQNACHGGLETPPPNLMQPTITCRNESLRLLRLLVLRQQGPSAAAATIIPALSRNKGLMLNAAAAMESQQRAIRLSNWREQNDTKRLNVPHAHNISMHKWHPACGNSRGPKQQRPGNCDAGTGMQFHHHRSASTSRHSMLLRQHATTHPTRRPIPPIRGLTAGSEGTKEGGRVGRRVVQVPQGGHVCAKRGNTGSVQHNNHEGGVVGGRLQLC